MQKLLKIVLPATLALVMAFGLWGASAIDYAVPEYAGRITGRFTVMSFTPVPDAPNPQHRISLMNESGDLVIAIADDTLIYLEDFTMVGYSEMPLLSTRTLTITHGEVMETFPAQTTAISIKIHSDETMPPEEGIIVRIDGTPVQFPDVQPTIVNGRTLVPVRGVFEAMGFDVDWNGDTETASLSRSMGDNVIQIIQIRIGEYLFGNYTETPNGKIGFYTELDVPAQLIGGRTMLPIRAIAEAVWASVDWQNGTVLITTPVVLPTLIIQDVTPTGLSFFFENSGDIEFGYSEEFVVYTLQDGEWIPVPTIDDIAFTQPIYTIPPRSETTPRNASWYWIYGELPSGYYRFKKSILFLRDPGDFGSRVVYAEFTIR